MARTSLKSMKNKTVTISGTLKKVEYKNQIDKHDTSIDNVKILLVDVSVGGVQIDHVWLYERNKYYELANDLKNEKVKFRGVVKPYVKRTKSQLFREDYGIERKSTLMTAEKFNQEKPFKKMGSV
ncbi:hypothetical protein [Staphylococcus warneri]|uniref:hypothetical protein n=1 Tax=Staphylococcus warneri TaxID=1292 RepID=UPI0022E45E93|nr:hypothetical protein [Staphylococcus warneri]